MNDHAKQKPAQADIPTAAPESQGCDGSSHYEADEIKGWALQWDTTELRKTKLARKMRHLRQASPDQQDQ